jgi:uncharacterized membrane protein YwaF
MKFELWSIWHFLYISSPFCIFAIIYFLIKDKSNKSKNIIGIILGALSLFIIIIRNIDIFVRSGWGVEVIPLQVCHIGSIVAGLALILKKKWLINTTFCFNMIPAFLAMIFADSLANYDTLWKIRPQTYVWGHIFIVVCALYGMFVYLPKLTKKDLRNSIIFVSILSIIAIICNSLFRAILNWEPNYFYLYDYSGTPLKFLYKVLPTSTYGWFTINWFYVIALLLFFILVFIIMYYIAKFFIGRVKKYNKQ